MERSIPLGAFRDCAHGVLISDRCGRVCFCNRAARCLLQTTPEEALGKPCWTVARFRGLDGESFCSVRCPVQHNLTAEHPEPLHTVQLDASLPRSEPLDLLSFSLPPIDRPRKAVMHVLLPHGDYERVPLLVSSPVSAATKVRCLTAREADVLCLLAAGLSTEEIAAALTIQHATVRNHVQRTLKKLGVHRRLEAVLAWMQSQEQSRRAS